MSVGRRELKLQLRKINLAEMQLESSATSAFEVGSPHPRKPPVSLIFRDVNNRRAATPLTSTKLTSRRGPRFMQRRGLLSNMPFENTYQPVYEGPDPSRELAIAWIQ